MDLKSTYNKVADDYGAKADSDERYWQNSLVEQFIKLFKPGDSILDIGCGPGVKSKRMADAGLQVSGLDFSERMIEKTKALVPDGKFWEMDIKDLDQVKEIYDGILAFAVLLHFPKSEARKILQKMVDHLNSSGSILVAVKEVRKDRPEEHDRLQDDYGYEYTMFFSYYSLDDMRQLFADCGLEVINEQFEKPGNSNWIILTGKKK